MRASPAPPVYGVRMVCHVKVNLLAQYRITTEAYSLALSAVERRMCASSKAGLSDLLKSARDARRLSSDALLRNVQLLGYPGAETHPHPRVVTHTGRRPPRRPFVLCPLSTLTPPLHPAVFLCEIGPCHVRNTARSIQRRQRRSCSPIYRQIKRALSMTTTSPVQYAQRCLKQPARRARHVPAPRP